MYRFYGLTLIAVIFSYAAIAQESQDTTGVPAAMQINESSFFIDFSCVLKNANNIDLQWNISNNTGDGDYFTVERSQDGLQYVTVSILKIADTATRYGLTDSSTHNGNNFYRIKYISKSGKFIYSKPKQVSLSGAVDFRFYPNPVDKLLIISSSHYVEVQVLDEAGSLKLDKQLQPGVQIINTSSLEKGSYVLKVDDKDSNRIISERLVKN